ncbi:50S ribosomal protein L31e [Candidatus Pacearchaeota archaeon]|nr:50S ribosomal protein L31e [Candidatus Pacearchaeota archaeon]
MAKKTETKIEKLEREYVIPLREKVRVVPRYKKTNKAVKTIKEFLARHMKIRDRNLNKIKIDRYLNEFLWFRGIRKPPHKIKVKAVKEGEIVRVELAEMPDKLKFKKAREEKMLKKAKEILEGKKTKMAKSKEVMEKPIVEKGEEEEKKEEEKEKKSAVVEAGKEIEKAAAKQTKHATKTAGKMTQQKHQVRKALAK